MRNGEIQTFLKCDYFSIEINKEGLKQKCWEKTLGERLKGNDIASIILHYDNNTEKEIYVVWGKDDFTNKYQKTTYTPEENIMIEIKKEMII